MKKVVVAIVVLGLIMMVALPVINLVVGLPVPAGYAAIETTTDEMKQAKDILGAKCAMCHAAEPMLPFYAKLPVAGQMVAEHVEHGTEKIDLQALLAAGGDDEILLAKLEQSIRLNTMPIKSFLLMHWNGRMSEEENQKVLAWIHQVRAEKFATGLASETFKNDAVQPLPDAWPGGLSEKKVALGDKLYHDKRLSGDDTLSCASCHDLAKAGTDNAQFSEGVRGQLGGINAPTSFNAMFNVLQFWDGRAKDLADQAGGPPLNPIEMDGSWEQINGKLAKDADLTALYQDVYGTVAWNSTNITDAIAEFENTLITPNSGLDRYLKGEGAELTPDELEGYALFKAHSCATCHAGKIMGGRSFEKCVDPVAFYKHRGREINEADHGRFNATKEESDRYKLKVPTLRNIALTQPYLHDGSTSDLKEVVTLMNGFFVPELNRQPLSEAQTEQIVSMLKKNNGVLAGKQL